MSTSRISSKKDIIVKKGAFLIFKKGFTFSLRDLAREVGCSKPAFYNYFEKKEHLIEEIKNHYPDSFLWWHIIINSPGRKNIDAANKKFSRLTPYFHEVYFFIFTQHLKTDALFEEAIVNLRKNELFYFQNDQTAYLLNKSVEYYLPERGSN